jgi:hypothetical protein
MVTNTVHVQTMARLSMYNTIPLLVARLYWRRSIDIRQPGIEEQHVVPKFTTAWSDNDKYEKENGEHEYEKLGKLFHS